MTITLSTTSQHLTAQRLHPPATHGRRFWLVVGVNLYPCFPTSARAGWYSTAVNASSGAAFRIVGGCERVNPQTSARSGRCSPEAATSLGSRSLRWVRGAHLQEDESIFSLCFQHCCPHQNSFSSKTTILIPM